MEKMSYEEAVNLGLEELYRRRDEMVAKSKERNVETWNTIQLAITHLEKQSAAERKEDPKTIFELPKDYSELFGDPRANEEIQTLVQQTIDQVSEYYESKLAEKDTENLNSIRQLQEGYDEQILQMQRQNKELQEELASTNETYAGVVRKVQETEMRLRDAEQKRDAAKREIESLKAQIVELEQLTAKPKKTSLNLSLSSGISDDNPRIKSSRELALERAGITMPVIGGKPVGESFRGEDHHSSDGNSELDANRTASADAEVSSENVTFQEVPPLLPDGTGDAVHESLEGTNASMGFNAEEEIERLKKRVDRLERQANIFGEVA